MYNLDRDKLRERLLSGKAIVTFRNSKTNGRFTFRISKLDSEEKELYFVSVLTGEDNTNDYTYMGCIFDGRTFRTTRKSRLAEDAPSVRAFTWIWNNIDNLAPQIEVYHSGHCLRCGRRLTVPESVSSGYGPECVKHFGG